MYPKVTIHRLHAAVPPPRAGQSLFQTVAALAGFVGFILLLSAV
jgi:hypothetical protein